jgi:hypothetical protein
MPRELCYENYEQLLWKVRCYIASLVRVLSAHYACCLFSCLQTNHTCAIGYDSTEYRVEVEISNQVILALDSHEAKSVLEDTVVSQGGSD